MGELFSFIVREFSETSQKSKSETRNTAMAIPASSAIPYNQNSQNSHNSRGPRVILNYEALQRAADTRNAQARIERPTDRYCRCGRLAECAWPLDGRHELWRCFECLEQKDNL